MAKIGYYIPGQADGAIPNGARIRKAVYEENDGHQIGAKGTVLSSHGPVTFEGKSHFCYFVEWDDMPGLPVFVVEYKIEKEKYQLMRKFGPKSKDHPSCGEHCFACKQPFQEGDYTTLIPLGPGDDPESQERAREGRPYNAIAIEIHWSCATGEKT